MLRGLRTTCRCLLCVRESLRLRGSKCMAIPRIRETNVLEIQPWAKKQLAYRRLTPKSGGECLTEHGGNIRCCTGVACAVLRNFGRVLSRRLCFQSHKRGSPRAITSLCRFVAGFSLKGPSASCRSYLCALQWKKASPQDEYVAWLAEDLPSSIHSTTFH